MSNTVHDQQHVYQKCKNRNSSKVLEQSDSKQFKNSNTDSKLNINGQLGQCHHSIEAKQTNIQWRSAWNCDNVHIKTQDNISNTDVVSSAPVKTCNFTTVRMQYQKLTDMQWTQTITIEKYIQSFCKLKVTTTYYPCHNMYEHKTIILVDVISCKTMLKWQWHLTAEISQTDMQC